MQTLEKIQFNARPGNNWYQTITYPKNEAAVVAQNIEVMVSGHNSFYLYKSNSKLLVGSFQFK